MEGARSYGDPCGISRALDHVGERWALLVVRELLLGPKRFSDLLAGLAGVSKNVLSQRLVELEQSDVVRRRKLSQPASTQAYELTPHGQELKDVLLALARWGSRAPRITRGELSPDSLMIALFTTFDPAAARGVDAQLELRIGSDRFRATIAKGAFDIQREAAVAPRAVITADASRLRRLIFGGESLAQAAKSGAVQIDGDGKLAARFVGMFPRPKAA